MGGFDDVDVLVNMSSHTIRRAIASFFSKKSREDLLVLYFSGHGVLDDQGRLYLAVRDTDSKLLRGTAISASYITDEMNNSFSQRQVLILDCCHSGAFARGTKGTPGASVGTASAFEGTGYGRVVLTASDATQYAWEGEQVVGEAENSLFTHYLLQGITKGEADLNGDGQITIDELYNYVYERVVRQTPKQTPGKWSYKERGEIVVSRTPGKPYEGKRSLSLPEFDREGDQKLEKLYNEGLSAYWLEDWDKAVLSFQAIVEARSDYPDAADKLELSRRKKQVHALYEKSTACETSNDWAEAVACLEELLALVPDYPNAAARLEQAKRNRLLADLYNEARQLSQAMKWQAVVNVFTQIARLKPDYPDPDGLLAIARANVAETERQALVEGKYNQALREMDRGNWEQAEHLLSEVVAAQPDHPSAARLLERARGELSRQKDIRQRREQLDTLYQQALGLARAEHWHKTLEKMDEIHALDPGFDDIDGLRRKAQAEIERQDQQAQLQNQLAEMYAAALRSLEAGQYQQALEQWGEIHALDPAYPDRQKVATTASKKLKELSKIETPRTSVLARLPVFRIVLFALFGIGLVAVIIYLARPGAVFDDFENKQFDGAYNPEIWGYEYRSDPNRGVIAQQDGVLGFTSDGAVNVLQVHLLQAFKKPLKAGTVIEARLRVDESSAGAHIGFGLGSDAYGGRGAACQIQAAGGSLVHCWVDISGISRSLPFQSIPPGTWHKLSIEIVELEPFILNFYADDKHLGQVVTENINDIGEQQFVLGFLLHSVTRGHNQGYVDDVYFGPIR
jgi:tetratricopeptide (TPR) repeat protein